MYEASQEIWGSEVWHVRHRSDLYLDPSTFKI